MRTRYGFAGAYLACFVATELVYAHLSPDSRDRLVAWASTDVANLEHEPVGPLLASAFVTPADLLTWPVLIALALFGANRALGNLRTALVCLAGQVIGTLVSEGIVAYRIHAGQLPAADRYLQDVGPSYVVMSAIVIAILGGTWLARALAVVDFAILVFVGDIFGGLSHLDVAPVGHLTAMLTATAATVFILTRRGPAPGSADPRHLVDGQADQVGDRHGAGPQQQLPERPPPEGPVGQPGH